MIFDGSISIIFVRILQYISYENERHCLHNSLWELCWLDNDPNFLLDLYVIDFNSGLLCALISTVTWILLEHWNWKVFVMTAWTFTWDIGGSQTDSSNDPSKCPDPQMILPWME